MASQLMPASVGDWEKARVWGGRLGGEDPWDPLQMRSEVRNGAGLTQVLCYRAGVKLWHGD